MRRLSISSRLALWYGLSLFLLLGLVAGFLYVGFHYTLHRDFDRELEREARRLSDALAPHLDGGREDLAEVALEADGTVYLLSSTGVVIAQSGPTRDTEEPPSLPPSPMAAFRSHTGPQGPTRIRFEPLATQDGELVAWLAVTAAESRLHQEMHRLGWLLAVGLLFGVVVAALSGYGLAKRALRPVAALTEAASRIGPGDQGARLPASFGVRDELTDLADAFNALLARLDRAFEREHRFRADAAHELLTPVTAAQSEVDVALRRDRDAEAYRTALLAVRGHTDRMADLVTGLLALSRAEGATRTEGESVCLESVASTVVERFRSVAEAKGIAVEIKSEKRAATDASPQHVELIAEIFLDNAVKYTPSGGFVRVATCTDSGDAVLTVEDTGLGFTEDEEDRLFERFYRANRAEVTGEQGSGLGLAIARRLAELHGGRIEALSDGPGKGSTFSVRFPVTLHHVPDWPA